MFKTICNCVLLFVLVGLIALADMAVATASGMDSTIVFKKENYVVKVEPEGFRYGLWSTDGSVILPAHSSSGLLLLKEPVVQTTLVRQTNDEAIFSVTNRVGAKAKVTFTFFDHYFKLAVAYDDPQVTKGSILARTGGVAPVYGLADHAGFRRPYSTEITGYKSHYFGAGSDHGERLVSNFVISPKNGVACINLDPDKKMIAITGTELAQGSYSTEAMPALYYFTGSVKQIYADYLKVRNAEGYKVYKPKYAWFGVGWEAFGALGWHTNHTTVTEDVDHYLDLGFPLRWMVVGSGFWQDQPEYFATTSFGYWDKEKYPDPKQFVDHFHKEGLKFILGLRIAFIPHGPFTQEGLDKGYFIKKNGESRLFRLGFPHPQCYFLDANNPAAVQWYVDLCDKWKAYGVDGYKEDLYGYEIRGLPDDKLDPVNAALMDEGVYIMGRNGYVGGPMDISRYNDFNYNQDQDRGPVNGLAFAYSGFPYVYPDIIGGTGLTNKQFGKIEQQRIGTYLMRESIYAALNPSMSFGYGPWNLADPQVLAVCLKAAHLHDRLLPYIYSEALHTYHTGFPYTMTPLPLVYPQDSSTYYRENQKVRGYEWLIGGALLATPLYGNDYAKANSRDIYLPEGKWIGYDDGKVYQGPVELKDFALPVDKTPLFIGGTGWVVEQQDGELYGRVYPTGYEGQVTFYGKEEGVQSVITINGFTNKPVVRDNTSGKKVTVRMKRHAWEFAFIPGHDYTIE